MGDNAVVNGVNLLSINDELVLHDMLDKAEEYEDRKKIRGRLKDVLADLREKREEIIRRREEDREGALRARVQGADEQKRRTLQMYDAMAKSAPAGGNKIMDVNILREGRKGAPGSPTTVEPHKVDLVEQAIRDRQKDANERKALTLAAYDKAAKSGPAGSARFINFDAVKKEDVENFESQKPFTSCFQMKGGIPIAAPAGSPIILPRQVEEEYDPMEAAIRKRQQACDDQKRRTLAAYDKAAKSRPAGTPISIYIPSCEGVDPVIEVAELKCRVKLDNPTPPNTPPRSRHQFYDHPTNMMPRYKAPGVTEDFDTNHYYRPTPPVDDYIQAAGQAKQATTPHTPPQQQQPLQAQPFRQQQYAQPTNQYNQAQPFGQQQYQPQPYQQQQYKPQPTQQQQYKPQPTQQQQYPQYKPIPTPQNQQQYQPQPYQQQQQYQPQPYQQQQQQPQVNSQHQAHPWRQAQHQPQQQYQPPQQAVQPQYNQSQQHFEEHQQQQQYKSSHFYNPNQNRNVSTSHPVAPPKSAQGYQQQVSITTSSKSNLPPQPQVQQQQQGRSTATVTLQPQQVQQQQQQQNRQVTQTTQQIGNTQRVTTTSTTTTSSRQQQQLQQQQYYEDDDEEEEEEEEEEEDSE